MLKRFTNIDLDLLVLYQLWNWNKQTKSTTTNKNYWIYGV